jgi:DNA-directed RNA polymerase subunit RPC12/RpoP
MIPPINSISTINTTINSKAQRQSEPAKSTINKNLEQPIQWYCNRCGKEFAAPTEIENNDNKMKKFYCPYCNSLDIFNNKADCFNNKLGGMYSFEL